MLDPMRRVFWPRIVGIDLVEVGLNVRAGRRIDGYDGIDIAVHCLLYKGGMKMAGIEGDQPDGFGGRGSARGGGGIRGMAGRRAGTLTGYEQGAGKDEPVVQCHK